LAFHHDSVGSEHFDRYSKHITGRGQNHLRIVGFVSYFSLTHFITFMTLYPRRFLPIRMLEKKLSTRVLGGVSLPLKNPNNTKKAAATILG
jgi:hypothetical protein